MNLKWDTKRTYYLMRKAYDTCGYVIYAYKYTENGDRIYAKPIKLEFEDEPRSDYDMLPAPTLVMNFDTLRKDVDLDNESKLLEQKEVDKNKHIEDLMDIIKYSIMEKK